MFYESVKNTSTEHALLLETRLLLILKQNKILLLEVDLIGKGLYESMMSMAQEKSPENDWLTKEFYKYFWDDFKDIFIDLIMATVSKKKFISSQK